MSQRALSGAQFDVPIKNYGIDVVDAGEERHLRKFHANENVKQSRSVPISQIRAGQNYVDHDPAYVRHEDGNSISGNELPDGKIMLEDGHHRLVRAKSAGETHVSLTVISKYGKCHNPLHPDGCEYGYKS